MSSEHLTDIVSSRILTAVVVVLVAGGGTAIALMLARNGAGVSAPAPVTISGGDTSSSDRVDVDPDFDRVRSRIPKDGIPPVYDPEFVSAAESPLEDSSTLSS